MRATLTVLAVISLTFSSLPAIAQTVVQAPAAGPASSDTSLPGVTVIKPAGSSTETLPPGVSDPMKTNSTTGTVDQEDRCQTPGHSANANPSAEATTLPRPEQACH